MERKKIKILSNKNKDQQSKADPQPNANQEQKVTKQPNAKEKSNATTSKLSTAEKIKQAKLARKSKKTDDGKDKTSAEAPKKKKKRRNNGDSWFKKLMPLLFIVGMGYLAYQLIFWDIGDTPDDPPIDKVKTEVTPPDQANLLYGLDKTKYDTEEQVVQETQSLASFLGQWQFPRDVSQTLQTQVASYMRPAMIKEFQLYTLFFEEGETDQPAYIVYEPDSYAYITFCLLPNKISAKRTKREVTTTSKKFAGTIQTNISDLHSRKKLNFRLLPQLEDALAWSVDFYHLKPGAKYKMVYDEIFADGEAVGSQLHALEFDTGQETIRAFFYNDGFFDERSRPMKRAYLKSPVKYARISSKYNADGRKHPVLGKMKPHLGTDYAAPEGTPIRAISDGVISVATFKKNNGNYVKMKHDKTYESQYLHMSKIKDGIKPGARVKQGEVIGFVGSTGLATGPHVCFRFWKRGKQVDFVKERLPDSRQVPSNQTVEFIALRDDLLKQLADVD